MSAFPVQLGSRRLFRLFIVLQICVWIACSAPAQTFTTLVTFNASNGDESEGSLVQGSDGNFYGTTYQGGDLTCGAPYGCGTVFKVTPAGTLTTLHNFETKDGAHPMTGLVLGSDGNFYGTTNASGAISCMSVCGTIFRITPGGALTTIYNFCSLTNCADGAQPQAALIQGSDGNFYGTTTVGGDASCNAPFGCGTIFVVTPTGSLTTIHAFSGSDGASPNSSLLLASDGNFYGTTFGKGANTSGGTVFKITPGGTLTTLYSFCAQTNCVDGAAPLSSLVEGGDGNLYGTTSNGGDAACAPPVGCGTVFKITTSGALTTLHVFCSATDCPDGTNPYAGLTLGKDGNFYGTTTAGGNTGCNYGCGTVFSITPAGQLTTLHVFSGADGTHPQAGLIQTSNSDFYGATLYSGSPTCNSNTGCGTLFQLAVSSGKAATATTLQVAPPTIDMGATTGVTLSAAVKPASGTGIPTGTVTFFNGTTQIGQPETVSAGVATVNYDTSALTAKTYSIVATYSGDNSYSGSTSSAATLTVTSALDPTSTTISISATPSSTQADVGSSVTMTATVAHSAGASAPTGSVTFLNGSTTLGTATLDSSGAATYSTSSLGANQYSITARYAGDGTYAGSSSSAAGLDVVDFKLAAAASSLSVNAPGQSASTTLTVSPVDGFSQAVSYACAGLPAGAACSFTSTTTGTTMTISTTASTSAAVRIDSTRGGTPLFALLLPGLFGLLAAGARMRRLRFLQILTVLVVLGLSSFAVGCSAMNGALGGGGSGGNSGTPAGTSNITVSATAGSLSHQVTVSLTVQ